MRIIPRVPVPQPTMSLDLPVKADSPQPRVHLARDSDSGGDESDSDSEAYLSFDSDIENDENGEPLSEAARHADHLARELERQRVMNAAGLILKRDQNAPPRPTARKPPRSRRRPPPAPKRSSSGLDLDRNVPSIPGSPTSSLIKVDDAYDKYEHFKQNNTNDPRANRISVASTDTGPPSPASLSLHLSPSRDGTEGGQRGPGGLLQLFSHRTHASSPVERRSVASISGPIIDDSSSSHASITESKNFGNVRRETPPSFTWSNSSGFSSSLGPVWWTVRL